MHPQIQAMRDARAAAGAPQLYTLTVEEARAADLASIRAAAGTGEPVGAVEEHVFGDGLPIRLYRPLSAPDGPLPVVAYFFGGGWTVGGIDTADGICRTLANAVPALVAVPGYRLAPEHKFPAAVEDCYAAVQWLASTFGPVPIAVAGDSAGGNLAAAVALLTRDRGGAPLCGQALVYPNTDQTAADDPSIRENTDPYLFNATSVRWYLDNYLGGADDARDPRASPMLATDHSGLPPAVVVTAEFDPLRDQAERYAEVLAKAGVPVEATRYDGMVHGFFTMTGTVDAAGRAQAQVASALRRWFAA